MCSLISSAYVLLCKLGLDQEGCQLFGKFGSIGADGVAWQHSRRARRVDAGGSSMRHSGTIDRALPRPAICAVAAPLAICVRRLRLPLLGKRYWNM